MHFRKGKAEITVMEAVNNLSHMAEVDVTAPEETEKPLELTEEQLAERMHLLSWHAAEYHQYNQERIRETFRAILRYLKDSFEKEKGQLRDEETQRGIQAMMLLVGEAAQKIDNYTDIFKTEGESVTELKEYKDLQQYYLTKIVQRFQKTVKGPEKWQKEWGAGIDEDFIGVHQGGLKNLESVRKDKEYELFFIRNEEGHPFFNRSLMHHLQLIGQFDFMLRDVTRENPFLRIPMIKDRDAQAAAKEVFHLASPYIEEYYKEAMKFKQNAFVNEINKAIMALMLAANGRNLMQTAAGKCCLNYYSDFHGYLRKGLQSKEYLRFIAHPPGIAEQFLHSLVNLTHVLAASFFLRGVSKKEMIAFIHMLVEKGAKGSIDEKPTSSPLSMWNTLLDQDDNIRHLLRQYPNGPLMITLRLFSKEKQLTGFDPLAEQNYLGSMYTIEGEDLHLSCLKLPSPTSQHTVGDARPTEEFLAFLRSIGSKKRNQRHLLINLQDRTTSHELPRCTALEELQKNTEFASTLVVVTFPKNTDFYLQIGDYLELNDAKEFKHQLKEQIASAEQCGFYFPHEIEQKMLNKFTDEAFEAVHEVFFGSKDALIHKNRLDFIEIFYQFLILKLVEQFKPDTFSFTCKDAIDTGAAASAAFFAFMRMMNNTSLWSKQEKDFLLWMIYSSALVLRERAIDPQRLNRMVSALSLVNGELEANGKAIVDICSKLFKSPLFEELTIKESE